MEFYATASPGTEEALRDELLELGFQGVRLNRGGIPFQGEWEDGWRACLHSRIAQRIQLTIARFTATTPDELYDQVKSVDWTEHLTDKQTFSIGSFCRSKYFTHSGNTALKVKDAIVDQVRDKFGERPDVDRDDPDVRIFVYASDEKIKLYLDLSGEPLHKRGYRKETGEAPMRETLAAAQLRTSGWDRSTPLADPMCGSGTLVIEAALWAGNIAPGIFRERFGFERWASYDEYVADTMKQLRGQARRDAHGQVPAILGSDCDPTVLAAARKNAKAAGVRLQFRESLMEDFQPGNKYMTIVSNPPYNERLAASHKVLQSIASALCKLHGKRVCLLSPFREMNRHISVKPLKRVKVKNGNIDCEFLVYDIT